MISTLQFIAAWLQSRYGKPDPEPQCTADWFSTGQGDFFGHISGCPIHGNTINEADWELEQERKSKPTGPRSIP